MAKHHIIILKLVTETSLNCERQGCRYLNLTLIYRDDRLHDICEVVRSTKNFRFLSELPTKGQLDHNFVSFSQPTSCGDQELEPRGSPILLVFIDRFNVGWL